jgi:tetratricopeptide (TPR) repeat protein
MQMDPGYYQAQVTLSILLYTGLGKPKEAVKLLDDARTRLAAQLVPEERQWIHLHLGHAFRVIGDIDRAAASYEQTKLLVDGNIQAWLGLAEMKLAQATTRPDTKPEDREKLLRSALQAAMKADSLLDKLADALTTLRFEDVPEGVELPFDRREYNRSVLDLRKTFRLKQRGLQLTIARIKVILGEKKEGILVLRRIIEDLGIDASDESRKIEADARAFLGTLYEEMGQALLALKEYRKVLKDLDPRHVESTKGMERLRRLTRQAGEAGN